MYRLIFLGLCAISFHLHADSTSTRCPGETNSSRHCIKTTCDARGYCSDLLYDSATGKTQPFPASHDQEVTKQKIVAIDAANKRVSLEDGSHWNISGSFVATVTGWKAGELVQLNHSQGYGYPIEFNLINLSRSNQPAIVELVVDHTYMRNPANFQHFGKSFDASSSTICLNDGTCWQYNPETGQLRSTDIVNFPVLYSVNTGLDALTHPVQLVLLGNFPPRLVAVKLSQP